MVANNGQIELRGGLESERFDFSRTIQIQIDQAIETAENKAAAKAYLAYRARASEGLRRRRILSAIEHADPRFFECRACGLNPYDPVISNWFFPLDQHDRREMVRLSRKIRTGFYVTNVTIAT